MRTFPTGAAQPLTNTNERARKLFENRPMKVPVPLEYQNKSRKKWSQVIEEEEVPDEVAPVIHASELEAPEDDELTSAEDEPEEE